MTAVYIINMLSTPILKNKTPFELLFGTLPSYSNMKVFGCLSFAANISIPPDKFKPCGVPCVFLGYPAHQKEYTLLNLFTNVIFVSRDVTIYEQTFSFHPSV